MKFTEEKLERAFIVLLGNENHPHFQGDSIVRATDEVLIEADLLNYLLTKYESNKTIMRWFSDGFILKREDRNQKDGDEKKGKNIRIDISVL
jgi:type I restriction enzyme R subunit